ncbi:MAG: hypothetical protein ACR2NM_16260 [Bythopirellula sp.]
MDPNWRKPLLQASISRGLPSSAAGGEPHPEAAGVVEIADELLDAFLPDDDLEPLPEPDDFWLE